MVYVEKGFELKGIKIGDVIEQGVVVGIDDGDLGTDVAILRDYVTGEANLSFAPCFEETVYGLEEYADSKNIEWLDSNIVRHLILSKKKDKIKYKEVPFEVMLKCDGEIICESSSLSNINNRYGIDFREPILFNELLKQIGTHLTSLNCQMLFQHSKWYVIDDGVQPHCFME